MLNRALKCILAAMCMLALLSGCAQSPAETTPEPPAQTRPTDPPIPENLYGPEDFRFEDGFLSCIAGQATLGIDVSYYQGDIDWAAVRASGIEFAIIRLGYRSYDEGLLFADEKAVQNLAGAKAAGLKIGAYFFSQAITEAEALEEAAFALELLAGYTPELPVVFDWEVPDIDTPRTADVDSDTLMACTKAFCKSVEDAGLRPMIYFNRDQEKHLYKLKELTQYPWWLAMYSEEMTFPYRVDIWQYSQEGQVPGIEGYVDLDLWFP